jgi:hypothetical protein
VDAYLRQASFAARSLADLLAAAETSDAILRQCQRHASRSAECVATLISNAVRCAQTDAQRLKLAACIVDADLKSLLKRLKFHQARLRPQGYNRADDGNFDRYLEVLSSAALPKIIDENQIDNSGFSMVELMYGAIGNLAEGDEKPNRIEFWSPASTTENTSQAGPVLVPYRQTGQAAHTV